MINDYVILVGRVFLGIAAFFLTLVPVLYLRLPWYKSPLGRVVMLQSATLALAIDLKAALTYLKKDGKPTTLIWINTVIVIFIAFSAFSLTALMWSYAFGPQIERAKPDDSEHEARPSDLERGV